MQGSFICFQNRFSSSPPRHFLHDNNAWSPSSYTVTTSLPIRAARPPSTPPQHIFLNCFTSAFTIGIYLATSSSCTQESVAVGGGWKGIP
ncbi:hypothetical protein C1H46_030145 [Malus baccata]|uniref:Uncharacterized protein n=1 Tax=Malus baccata TaxID=106549 RepID=A0A540LCV6_MALBA|nr:hypothetical protein C1H46_030145 [Malus baccata]